ncbi:MAG TPA: hypothetical protein VNJ50_00105 [Gelidibacter sp.]|uniref:hypothetical protein n=1 Tax=Gelidibacter sp. TaxID=2018083 RepID=UPI002C30ACAF|nr:hypothetical protein [Gelidibacter sp.]HXJ97221.1 hypothetical protein [Gelidibacter sp.]
MKQLSTLIIFSLFACVGPDTAFLPQTIKESKENKLLINIYSVSDKLIRIKNENFEILDVWSTYKLEKKYSNKINNNFFVFRICLKNVNTGKIEPPLEYYSFIKSYCNDCSNNNIGIIDSMLSIICQDVKLKDKINSFKIGFIDDKNNEKIVVFEKQ